MHFDEIQLPTPSEGDVAATYEPLVTAIESADDPDAARAAVESWNRARRELYTWRSLARIRFRQDTSDEGRRADRELADALSAKLSEREQDVIRAVIASPHREELEEHYGKQAFAVWDCELASYDPAIEEDFVAAQKLSARYQELTAESFEFDGEKMNLSRLRPFLRDKDREVRQRADRARWEFFGERAEELDQIYHDLVQLRTSMARKLGHDNYIPLGYQSMTRIGYGPDDVARFRKEVREQIVPLAARLRERQAKRLGVDALKVYDESVYHPEGDPRPRGDVDWIVEQSSGIFAEMHPTLGEFFSMMRANGLLDLPTRDGKAGGGFCAWLSTERKPFIFANFSGVRSDIKTLIHEVGHAYQHWMCRDKVLDEYVGATHEACEIHSMSLEYLTWPWMDRLFAEDAERYKMAHLTDSICFVPYGVAVDHFQHMVYGEPEASPERRREMWQECEEMYLPWRCYEDPESHPSRGGYWQVQRHIYAYPFYYIDYTLAGTVAMQLWARSQKDFDGALDIYLDLCKRGGEAPFEELVVDAGLASPFETGCLTSVAHQVEKALDLA